MKNISEKKRKVVRLNQLTQNVLQRKSTRKKRLERSHEREKSQRKNLNPSKYVFSYFTLFHSCCCCFSGIFFPLDSVSFRLRGTDFFVFSHTHFSCISAVSARDIFSSLAQGRAHLCLSIWDICDDFSGRHHVSQ